MTRSAGLPFRLSGIVEQRPLRRDAEVNLTGS